MPAERAGYTVTMFIVDVSRTMGATRTVELPDGPNGEERTTEITNLEWGLQFVKLKIQEMIYNGRKTDQCGVVIFGTEGTSNALNTENGGYENVTEYLPIAQPTAQTLADIDKLRPSTVSGDPIDALIVGIQSQDTYLARKKTWTRRIVLLTDGEGPIEVEDWEETVGKMGGLGVGLTVIGVDFDDEELPFIEENKAHIKRQNEAFYLTLTSALPDSTGVLGTLALALREIAKPDLKQTKSVLMGTVLRLGDTDTRPEEAVEVLVKTSKCTALARPKGWKKFAVSGGEGEGEEGEEGGDGMDVDEDGERKVVYAQLKLRSEYYVDRSEDKDEDEDVKMEDADDSSGDKGDKEESNSQQGDKDGRYDADPKTNPHLEQVEKEELIRGFKYGTSYAPCPDGQFARLPTRKGIDICGFFSGKNFRRDLSMGEIQYVWADPSAPQQQIALSSIAQAMFEKDAMAIARWVTKDGMDPKMGVLAAVVGDGVDYLLWAQMPFADDVRKYTFASLDHLVNKKGEVLTEHPYIPTEEQLDAMDSFVDAMDLMKAGEMDEAGKRGAWYDPSDSYNPSLHRVKQASFHSAVVSDLDTNPLPPPHPELLKYLQPPRRVLKRAADSIEACKSAFKVRQVPKRVVKARKDGHDHARDDDEEMLLLDRKQPPKRTHSKINSITEDPSSSTSPSKMKAKVSEPEDNSDTEDDEEEEDFVILDKVKPKEKDVPPKTPKRGGNNDGPLPTPARSLSPPSDSDMGGQGREPGRIIGSVYPLTDFKKNLERGDVVSKAVEDLGVVVTEIVMRPFSSRRTGELMECMEALRDTCLKEDEVEAWNAFLQDLREKCESKPGNTEFWSEVQKIGRGISLISDKEAKKYGGASQYSEAQAKKFLD